MGELSQSAQSRQCLQHSYLDRVGIQLKVGLNPLSRGNVFSNKAWVRKKTQRCCLNPLSRGNVFSIQNVPQQDVALHRLNPLSRGNVFSKITRVFFGFGFASQSAQSRQCLQQQNCRSLRSGCLLSQSAQSRQCLQQDVRSASNG